MRTSVAPRWLSALGISAGGGYVATGLVVAAEGFSGAALTLSLASDPLFLAFAIGLLVIGAGRVRRSPREAAIVSPRVPEPVR